MEFCHVWDYSKTIREIHRIQKFLTCRYNEDENPVYLKSIETAALTSVRVAIIYVITAYNKIYDQNFKTQRIWQ